MPLTQAFWLVASGSGPIVCGIGVHNGRLIVTSVSRTPRDTPVTRVGAVKVTFAASNAPKVPLADRGGPE
ncbi:hypothetical protein [Kibdelosporangium philippinense]|uniref:hypothetical protein n=1 Tax=Kibdelosporangium philippinense TaxID=211113 RepID=UPI00361141A9